MQLLIIPLQLHTMIGYTVVRICIEASAILLIGSDFELIDCGMGCEDIEIRASVRRARVP